MGTVYGSKKKGLRVWRKKTASIANCSYGGWQGRGHHSVDGLFSSGNGKKQKEKENVKTIGLNPNVWGGFAGDTGLRKGWQSLMGKSSGISKP